MPKKTKKEKIISSYRRRMQMLQSTIGSGSEKTPAVNISVANNLPVKKPDAGTVKINNTVSFSEEDKTITRYFLIDFKKSLSLIFFIIALEIFLYFATMKHVLRFF